MKGFAKFRDGFVGPIVILTVIGLVCTWAVAATYVSTKPLIDEQDRLAAETARQEALAAGEDFVQYLDVELPEGVTEAYWAGNGAGFVFQAAFRGYGGDVPFMIGIDSGGKIAGIKMLENDETPGLGSKIGNKEYLDGYLGGGDPGAVDGVTGATRTSSALKKALSAALEAYEQLKDITPAKEGN
ncbi:MAG: FMN-binding protein [Oscillospiraceae bacterium]|jgi:electron transport complex protein RnfG|nr:FMN-binding protein [Oscillospiraceae bacterium]